MADGAEVLEADGGVPARPGESLPVVLRGEPDFRKPDLFTEGDVAQTVGEIALKLDPAFQPFAQTVAEADRQAHRVLANKVADMGAEGNPERVLVLRVRQQALEDAPDVEALVRAGRRRLRRSVEQRREQEDQKKQAG